MYKRKRKHKYFVKEEPQTKYQEKIRAGMNRTIVLFQNEIHNLKENLIKLDKKSNAEEIENKTINQDLYEVIEYLPERFVDLLFVDPPYNLTKNFNFNTFKKISSDEYEKTKFYRRSLPNT